MAKKRDIPPWWKFNQPTPEEVALRQEEIAYWRKLRKEPKIGPEARSRDQIRQDLQKFKKLYH